MRYWVQKCVFTSHTISYFDAVNISSTCIVELVYNRDGDLVETRDEDAGDVE